MKNLDKIIQHSDGARVETQILDILVTGLSNGEPINLDDMLALNKKAADHLKTLRHYLKIEASKKGS